MSQWIINDIKLYSSLAQTLNEIGQHLPAIINESKTCLEQLHRDIEVDLKETSGQLKKTPKENPEEESRLNQKIMSLKTILSSTEMLLNEHKTLESKTMDTNSLIQKGGVILQSFEQIGQTYLNLNTHNNSSTNSTGELNTRKLDDVRLLGNTFHFSTDQRLSQFSLQKMELEIKNSRQRGNKISIDNVSQLDFDLLKKQGYSIQEIKPNEFSAYKKIDQKL
jgi:hypothetical protein